MKKKVIILSSLFLFIDQIIKFLIEKYLVTKLEIIPSFFSLFKVYNKGAAFSIFSGATLFLIIINIIILIFLLRYMKNFKINKRNIMSFSLMIGGLLGNLLDRINFGYVIDYLKLDFGSYTFPIFNFADMCLCIGVILLIIAVFKKEDEYGNSSK